MENNLELLYSRLIAWLLEESTPAASLSTDGQVQSSVPTDEAIAADFELDQLDLPTSEELNIASSTSNTGTAAQDRTRASLEDIPAREESTSGGATRPYNLGDISTVENRFQALLKRRLQVEIERNPPLFPWETKISDYEPDAPDAGADSWVPPVRLWMPQLSNLSLPVSIPENVLAQLLDACTEAAYSRRQIGAKMVNAVEKLFPDQFQPLNRWTDRVLLGGLRSEQLPCPAYEAATTEQKMTLALLAAKEIISALTVPISSTQTPVTRQWHTSVGVVTVQADYQVQEGVPTLRVIGRLPRGGSLTLRTPQASASSQRTYPGYLSVESFDLQPNQTYPLEIRFHDSEQTPLIFAICPAM
ncbi:MAG TPA: hypothetical protein V6D14_24590 [Coleofasciculaceae cyanobacterium]